MVSPDKFALVERWSTESSPEEIAERYMSDADIVIAEGFKASALPKIEIFRRETGSNRSTSRARSGAPATSRSPRTTRQCARTFRWCCFRMTRGSRRSLTWWSAR